MTQTKLEDAIRENEPITTVKKCIAPHFMAKVERKRKEWLERREEFIKWLEEGHSTIKGFGRGETFHKCRLCDKSSYKWAYVKPGLCNDERFRIFIMCDDCFKKYGWKWRYGAK